MNFNDSRVLITGEAGFIGSHLAKVLLKEGDKITIFDDFSTGSMWNIREVKKLVADITKIKNCGFRPKVELKTGLTRFIHWYNIIYLQEQEDV